MIGFVGQLPLRPLCRVCSGTHVDPSTNYGDACPFCTENGRAKKVCPECHEALPLCPCFGEYRGVADG